MIIAQRNTNNTINHHKFHKGTQESRSILKFVEGEVYPLLVQQQHKQAEGGDGVCWKNSGNGWGVMVLSSISSVTSVNYTFVTCH
jgi:hypothetical protein